ncbi:hypothetical protein IJJ54_00990 [Candidatus Saccharibacteria bacterium]|nr:hypothetical protein [Candidatus Saccharibacteria bacterium]
MGQKTIGIIRSPRRWIFVMALSLLGAATLSTQNTNALDLENFLMPSEPGESIVQFDPNNPFRMPTLLVNEDEEEPRGDISYNAGDDYPYWGNDGYGIVFTDEDKIVRDTEGNPVPNVRTAQVGDTLNFSVKVKLAHYEQNIEYLPIPLWQVIFGTPEGLSMDESSVKVYIDGEELGSDDYDSMLYKDDADASRILKLKDAGIIVIEPENLVNYVNNKLDWFYEDGAELEIRFSATLDEDTGNELFGKAAYIYYYESISESSSSVSSGQGGYDLGSIEISPRATAFTSGNVLIRRIDGEQNPLAGAKYSIDGVQAESSELHKDIYDYRTDGAVSEFTTNEDGWVLVDKMPFGNYTVNESGTPEGHVVYQDTISKNVYKEDYNYMIYDHDEILELSAFDVGSVKKSDCSAKFDNGVEGFKTSCLGGDSTISLSWDSSTSSYKHTAGTEVTKIVPKEDGYYFEGKWAKNFSVKFNYDETRGKYVAIPKTSDLATIDVSTYYLEVIDDSTVRIYAGGTTYNEYIFDDGEGCFMNTNGKGAKVCKEGEKYQFYSIPHYSDTSIYYTGKQYIWDETYGKYVWNDPYAIIEIESVDEGVSATVSMFNILISEPRFPGYWINTEESLISAKSSNIDKGIYATEYLFREVGPPVEPEDGETTDEPTDGATPEDIQNPDTRDSVLVFVAVMVGAVAVMARMKLARR